MKKIKVNVIEIEKKITKENRFIILLQMEILNRGQIQKLENYVSSGMIKEGELDG
jgi:hypothetical protein